MCKIMEEMREDTARIAEYQKAIQIALNLLALGSISKEDISKATGLTLEKVKELASQISVSA